MDLVAVEPIFNLYDQSWPLRTLVPQTPPAKFVFADEGARMGFAVDSIVSPGCIISGGRVANSILGPDVSAPSYSRVNNSILFPLAPAFPTPLFFTTLNATHSRSPSST